VRASFINPFLKFLKIGESKLFRVFYILLDFSLNQSFNEEKDPFRI
tara:strand:- start:9054 stop:9191 length:138 start_codon:yes stop_codon:yes gene_type:complete